MKQTFTQNSTPTTIASVKSAYRNGNPLPCPLPQARLASPMLPLVKLILALVYYRLAMDMQPMSLYQLLLNNPEWALVGVGILTLFFIWLQAKATAKSAKATETAAKATQDSVAAIRQQVRLMERQTKATEDTAIAAIKTIDVMVSKERARIQVEPGTLEISPPLAALPIDGVGYRVRCHGTTPATIIETKVWAQISDSKTPHHGKSHNSIYLPSVFIPTADGVEGQTPLFYADELALNRVDIREEVHRKRLFVHFYGQVRYTDVFDKLWMYTFRYIYVPNPWAGVEGKWIKHGPRNDNVEIELASPD